MSYKLIFVIHIHADLEVNQHFCSFTHREHAAGLQQGVGEDVLEQFRWEGGWMGRVGGRKGGAGPFSAVLSIHRGVVGLP